MVLQQVQAKEHTAANAAGPDEYKAMAEFFNQLGTSASKASSYR
jgi:hypothetical protein